MTIRDATSGKTITLDCTRILRCIQGRRTVYEGLFDGKSVIIKCFSSALYGKHHFKKEIRGFKELTRRNIKTAQIVAAGQNEQKDHVVVLEKIENAVDVFSLLESTDDPAKTDLILQAVFICVAHMHAAGVLQRDLHTGNFLWDRETVYVLDPAEMTFSNNPLDKAASIRQLAMLLASLPESFWVNKSELLDAYFETRGWQLISSMIEMIENLMDKQRLKRIRRTLRKTLRTSKRYIQEKHGSYKGVFTRDFFSGQNFSAFISAIDKQMEDGQVLKCGNTCFVSRIQLNGCDVVVKHYRHKGLWHSLRYTLKGSRAKKCWLFGHRLSECGIATAKALGFFEQRKFGLLWQSYILNEFIKGPELHEVMNGGNDTNQQKEAILSKSKKLLENLTNARMTHGDMKPGNLLVCNGEPVLIDLDSMQYHRCSWILLKRSEKMTAFFHNRLHGKKCTE